MAKVGIFTFESYHGKHDIGSSRIRGEWVAKYWQDAELFRYAQPYETVIYQKVYALEHAKAYKGIKILDLCDPDWLGHQPVVEMARECNAITTSTQALAEFIRMYVDIPVVFIPDCIDFDENNQRKTEHAEHLTKAVWFGYAHNGKMLTSVHASCRQRGIHLTAISDRMVKDCDEWVKYDRETINDEIVKHDIAILPPAGGEVGRFKSDNKTINAWSLGMPVVCFASHSPEAEAKYGELAHLTFDVLTSKEAREAEAAKRYEYVRAERNATVPGAMYAKLIEELRHAA